MIDKDDLGYLRSAEDVTDEMLAKVEDCLEWFDDDEPLDTEEFIDRLSDTYLADFGVELDNYDSPASRKFIREARKIRRERG